MVNDNFTAKNEISFFSRLLKRCFDLFFSTIGILLLEWIIFFAYLLALVDTKKNGFFTQIRIGKNGNPFKVIKIRTMRESSIINTNVTTKHDPRITKLGSFFRKTKIDELPQLFNILLGHMSFVGPRPDVPGFADKLLGADRIVLSMRPGITGPATIKYRNEEELLAQKKDPEKYNREILFPDKVKLNIDYVNNYSFHRDLIYIFQTIFH